MKFRTNQNVITPLGAGVVEGQYETGGWLVRVKFTKENEKNLRKYSTPTPKAKITGLFVFDEREMK